MIARIWRGSVRGTDADEYTAYMRTTGVADYAATPGNRGAWMLRRDLDDQTEFVMVTLWDSLDAIRGFAGGDYAAAVLYPEDDRFLIERDLRVAHYDVAAAVGNGRPWTPVQAERASVVAFFQAYRAAFERFDAEAIADLFTYPCHITSAAQPPTMTTVSSREGWLPQLQQLVDSYHKIGVQTAQVVELDTVELAENVIVAVVRWELLGQSFERIYTFDASYTLLDDDGDLRISAIAHNEAPRLRARLADIHPH
jgi:heme-degrading monooxygenase HmoA